MGDFAYFEEKFRKLAKFFVRAYPGLTVDIEGELASFKDLAERIRPMVRDTVVLMNEYISAGDKRILVEGANAQMLDIDFGTYPYVTSSNCSVGGACTGL
eukprot:Awhi_evm1s7035